MQLTLFGKNPLPKHLSIATNAGIACVFISFLVVLITYGVFRDAKIVVLSVNFAKQGMGLFTSSRFVIMGPVILLAAARLLGKRFQSVWLIRLEEGAKMVLLFGCAAFISLLVLLICAYVAAAVVGA